MFDKINDYRTVSLDEIKTIQLMSRVDTKYIVATETMTRLLDELANDYLVLEIASQRYGQYQSVYYDTVDLQMFYTHVTTRFPRFKVRERTYSQNDMQFLEVKYKKANGRTSKKRLPMANRGSFDETKNDFVADNSPFCLEDLQPKLSNQFNRITLVNRERTERVTLDFNLQYRSLDGITTTVGNNVSIIEVKQDKKVNSIIDSRLKDENIRPCSISKYCFGMLLINNNISYKMYKTKFVNFLKIA